MPIKEYKFNDLNKFWQFISPDGELVKEMGRVAHPIFRGQGKISWSLTPSALRKSVVDQYQRPQSIYSQTDHVMSFEYELLVAYLHHCDELGLAIPNDSREFRQKAEFFTFAAQFASNANEWPTEDFYSLLASAQHHGVPTRLLDWTRLSFIAAYFAGVQALEGTDSCGRLNEDIVVWGIDANKAHLLRHETPNSITEIHHVKLPGITSKNLAMQKGCFLLVKWLTGQSRGLNFDMGPSIDTMLDASTTVTLYKVILSHDQASNLIFKCNDFGISAATLFPSHDGAGKAAKEFKLAKRHSGRL
ncbi:MAG: FRG domain-containing protein [Burkholderiaceae bacterium]|nr:FRG domain-containing protein [Burkholderiaceae bacterium]